MNHQVNKSHNMRDLEGKLEESSSTRGIRRDRSIPRAELSLYDLRLLEELEEEPEVRQMDLAVRLGVSVATVNWHLKRLAAKGYVKVNKIGKWRWSYPLTPQGMADKARLTRAYVQQSLRLYRETRERAQGLLREVRRAGYKQVRIEGDNDLVDVCRLTCLEQGVKVVGSAKQEGKVPVLQVDGRELSLEWPEYESSPAGGHLDGPLRKPWREGKPGLQVERLLRRAQGDSEILAVIQFGSAGRGERTPSSDIDICLVFPRGSPDRLALSRKRLDYLKDTDLDLDVHIFQLLPIYIRRRALKEGQVLFCRDEEELYELAFRTAQAFEDFKHIYYEYLEEVAHAGP